jgi:hypothetical protein
MLRIAFILGAISKPSVRSRCIQLPSGIELQGKLLAAFELIGVQRTADLDSRKDVFPALLISLP